MSARDGHKWARVDIKLTNITTTVLLTTKVKGGWLRSARSCLKDRGHTDNIRELVWSNIYVQTHPER